MEGERGEKSIPKFRVFVPCPNLGGGGVVSVVVSISQILNSPVWSNFSKHPPKRPKTFTNNPQNAPKHKQRKSTQNIAQRLCNGFKHWGYMLVHACDLTTILQLLHDTFLFLTIG